METTFRRFKQELRPLLVITIALMLVTTVLYPLSVTGIGKAVFNGAANGSIVKVDGAAVGSEIVGQSFTAPEYFHGRPSAAGAGYDAASSSGSNLGPTSAKLFDGVEDDPATADIDESFAGITQRVTAYREENGLGDDVPIPADAVTASASGLDPHISPANARNQVARVAAARGIDESDVVVLLDDYTEDSLAGFFGEPRVNVLMLNIALDERFPVAK